MTQITTIKQTGYKMTINVKTNNSENVVIYRNTDDGGCIPQRIAKGNLDAERTTEEVEALSFVVKAFRRTVRWMDNGNTYLYLAFDADLERPSNTADNVYKVC